MGALVAYHRPGCRCADCRAVRRWAAVVHRRKVLLGLKLAVTIPAVAWVAAAVADPNTPHTARTAKPTIRSGSRGDSSPAAARIVAAAVGYALGQRDKPYVWGAEGPRAFDCSGLAWAAYHTAGLNWGRTNAAGLCAAGPTVPGGLEQARRGDLAFFHSTGPSGWHVGILLDPARMVHAPNARSVVRVERLTPSWRRRVRAVTRPALLTTQEPR